MGHPSYHVNVIKLKINERLYGQVGYPTYLHVNRPLRPHESFTRCISFLLTYAQIGTNNSENTKAAYSGLTGLYTFIFKNKNERRRKKSRSTIYSMQNSFET